MLQGQADTLQKNHPTVGRIAGGGIVEKEALGTVVCKGCARLLLKNPDFNTARKIAKAINPCGSGRSSQLRTMLVKALAVDRHAGLLTKIPPGQSG